MLVGQGGGRIGVGGVAAVLLGPVADRTQIARIASPGRQSARRTPRWFLGQRRQEGQGYKYDSAHEVHEFGRTIIVKDEYPQNDV
ncbi:hypothetical protein [Streptomyces sp. SYSU K217416]